jgi:ribose/xylose/arabinose/galactoside ABC-type transport system permease subunit
MTTPTTSPPTDVRVEEGHDGSRFAFTDTALHGLILTGFLVVIVIVFTSQDPRFLSGGNALNILVNASVIGIVSLGQSLTIISGGFDLSVSGTVPLGGVVFATLVNGGSGLLPALLVVLLVGAAVGLVNGLIVAKANINPLIATLGTMSIAGGLALTIANGIQIPFVDVAAGVLADRSLFGISNHVWILLGLSIVLHLVLQYTVFGRYLYSVGGNREAARLAGIPVDAVTIAVYVASAALASLAGVVLASQLLTGSGTAGTEAALQSIAAVILGGGSLTGGVGGVPGTLIGVLVLGTLANGMAILSVPAFYQTIATGAVLLLAVGISQIRRGPRRRR